MNAYIVKGHNALKMHDQHQIFFFIFFKAVSKTRYVLWYSYI